MGRSSPTVHPPRCSPPTASATSTTTPYPSWPTRTPEHRWLCPCAPAERKTDMLMTALNRTIAAVPVKRMLTLITISALLAVAVGLTATMLNPTRAEAAPKVSVSGTPKADGESELELSGSGFQSVEGGFGGIYVLFGWVDDPSG